MSPVKLRVFGGCAATAGIVTLVGGFTTVAVARTSVGMLAPPMIEGTPYKGSVLTCVSAEPRDPALVGWLWRRDGVQIPDATTQTYVVAGTDVGHRVGCAETVTESGATNIASSVEVEIILVSVRIVSDTRGVQSGPTLTLRGAIVADGPAAAGMLLLITLHGSKGVTVAREPVPTDGRFSLSKTVWGLVPGRYPFRIEFVPADPELHQPAQQLVAVTATSPSTYPFARTVADRRPTIFDGLTPFWSDGRSCSVGCVPRGALQGWPLEPFHEQHPLRAGLNELRPSGFHVGVDIMAFENQKVYAIQSGYAHVISTSWH